MWCYDPTGKRAAADRGSLSPDRWLIWVQIIQFTAAIFAEWLFFSCVSDVFGAGIGLYKSIRDSDRKYGV